MRLCRQDEQKLMFVSLKIHGAAATCRITRCTNYENTIANSADSRPGVGHVGELHGRILCAYRVYVQG